VERGRLLFAIVATLLALPILFLDNIARAGSSEAPVSAGAAHASQTTAADEPDTAVLGGLATLPPPPVAEVPTTEAPPLTEATTTTAPHPKATTTTEAPTPPATTAPEPAPEAPPPNVEEGGASWYDHHPGECAHRTLAFGTVVTVTNVANGATATCIVSDRGPFDSGRIIDLDRGVFEQLADPSVGVISVRITW